MTFSPSLQQNTNFSNTVGNGCNQENLQPFQRHAVGAQVVITKEKLSLAERTMVAILVTIVLLAITTLSLCIIAIFGYFPLLLSFLNIFTAGACLSLPLIVCLSTAVLLLSLWAIQHIVANPVTLQLISSSRDK